MEVLKPRPTGEGQKTLFVTFYSFKGGVGRTLAMLNVACILAGLGRRVLMIDFDLEAPGLTHFQDEQIEEDFSTQQPGLVDAIDAFLDDPWSSPLGDEEPEAFFENYVASLDVPEGVQKGEKDGTLDLVPAGRLDEEYENRLYDLDFEEMFEKGVGRPFFERLKDVIKDSGRYDYILIDSRTGFSDEGSICTRFLADYLMVLTGLNRQNVRGTARFLRQSNVAERDETLALVASPVPMYYEDLRAKRITAAKEHITERAGLDEVRFVTQIPYHPVLALEEDPTVRSLEGTDLFDAYEEITERLRTWAGDLPEERIERVLDLIRDGETKEALSVFHDVRQEDPEVALQFLRRTARLLADDYPESVVNLLEEGIAIAEEVGDLTAKRYLLSSLSSAFYKRGELQKSISFQEKALDISNSLESLRGEANDRYALGTRYGTLGDIERAIDYQKQALDLFHQLGDQSAKSGTLNDIGYWYLESGETERAIEFLEKARDLGRTTSEHFNLIYPLANLGICYARNGDEEDATMHLEQALEIIDDLDSSSKYAAIHLDRAQALAYVDPSQALEVLRNDWPFLQEHVDAFEKMRAHVLRARLRLEVENDAEGAVEDAQKALDFYRERDVDSRWYREAEEILEKAQTHEG